MSAGKCKQGSPVNRHRRRAGPPPPRHLSAEPRPASTGAIGPRARSLPLGHHGALRGGARQPRDAVAQGQAPRFGAIDDGALAVRIPRHARKELLAYLDCGLLCGPRPGFAPAVGADLPVLVEAKARAGARSLPLGHGELLGRLTQIFVDSAQPGLGPRCRRFMSAVRRRRAP